MQSIGAASDLALRDAIARGRLPGPRLLTSSTPLQDATLTPDQIRQYVRKTAADGADVIKIFASRSIREGGGQTLSDAQILAACDEAKAQGKRIWVHAHAASAVRAAALANCTAVTHGFQIGDAEARLMAERGTYLRAADRPAPAELHREKRGLLRHRQLQRRRLQVHGRLDPAHACDVQDGAPSTRA